MPALEVKTEKERRGIESVEKGRDGERQSEGKEYERKRVWRRGTRWREGETDTQREGEGERGKNNIKKEFISLLNSSQ